MARKREVETHGKRGYMGFLHRSIRACGPRVAQGDPVDLAAMFELRAELDRAIEVAVLGQRQTFSWGQIADGVGMPRQNLHRKFAHLEGVTNETRVTSSVA